MQSTRIEHELGVRGLSCFTVTAGKIALLAATAAVLLAFNASVAAAHCCHDSRALRVAAQDGLRGGIHGVDEGGLSDESIQDEPPTVGGGMNDGAADDGWSVGGLGSMRGNSLGNYGAGSLGQTGPGGLGAMQGTGLGGGPTIRGR
jgi:hypothetical protein